MGHPRAFYSRTDNCLPDRHIIAAVPTATGKVPTLDRQRSLHSVPDRLRSGLLYLTANGLFLVPDRLRSDSSVPDRQREGTTFYSTGTGQ